MSIIPDTMKLLKAIEFAHKCHLGQTRKHDKNVPFIFHTLATAILVAKAGGNESEIIAAILHDAIEDGKIKKAEIWDNFGYVVANIVDHLTEHDKTLPWEKRKEEAINHIKHMGRMSMLVKTADTMSNVGDILRDVKRKGEEAFSIFKVPKEKIIDRYRRITAELQTAWPKNPLLPQLTELIAALK